MKTCENCGKESFETYCAPCVRVMQAEAQAHEDSADAERFEAALDFEPDLDDEEALASAGHGMDESYMGGLDSDLMGEE